MIYRKTRLPRSTSLHRFSRAASLRGHHRAISVTVNGFEIGVGKSD